MRARMSGGVGGAGVSPVPTRFWLLPRCVASKLAPAVWYPHTNGEPRYIDGVTGELCER